MGFLFTACSSISQIAPQSGTYPNSTRAHIIQIGSQIIHLPGAQNLAGILDFLVGQLVVIGNQDAGNIFIHAVCSHLDLIPFQLPDQGLGPITIDQLSFIMFFQILYCGKRSSNKVGVVRHHSQLLERQDIIFNASCRILVIKTNCPPLFFTAFRNSLVPTISLWPIHTVPSISRRKRRLSFINPLSAGIFHLPSHSKGSIRIMVITASRSSSMNFFISFSRFYRPYPDFQAACLIFFQKVRHIQMKKLPGVIHIPLYFWHTFPHPTSHRCINKRFPLSRPGSDLSARCSG